jgi:acid phosphatase (class A)
MQILRLFVFLLVVASGVAAYALPVFAYEAHYVSVEELPPQLLVPPPSEGSALWRKDIQEVLAAQKHIGGGTLTNVRHEQELRVELVTDVLGPDFTREKFPRPFALIDRVFEDSEAISGADKKFWHIKRPYLADRHVKLFVDRIDQSPSYPSGHTCGSRVVAEVLGMLYPERLEDLRARADSVALHRVVAGVHYPSDIEAGRLLAAMIVGALMKSEAFREDLEEARGEHP